ncbi:MAG TPA: fimbria/pilus outer membrane usher protein [Steroidobacteraceae bacterium]
MRACAVLIAIAATLAGCNSEPTRLPEPDAVAVTTNAISGISSSINATVLNQASAVDYSFAASLDPHTEALTRLQSSYTQSFAEGEQKLRVGDTVSSSGMWGSAVRYGGMQFGTGSDQRADVIESSRLASTGIAVLPTTADALFASAGNSGELLTHQNLSVDSAISISGPNALSFVAHDSLGRTDSITAPIIAGTSLAAPGCADFSFGLGKVRRDYAVSSNDYGRAFANTTVTCGVPLGFTIEGHGEYLADEVTALGLGISRQMGEIGTASVALASSRAQIGSGWLARVGFEHESALFNVMLRSRMQSRDFREISSALNTDPVMQRNLASVGVNLSESSSLALAYAAQTTWDRERAQIIALSQSTQVGRGQLSLSAGHSLAVDNVGMSVFIGYKRPFGSSNSSSRVDEVTLDLLDKVLDN